MTLDEFAAGTGLRSETFERFVASWRRLEADYPVSKISDPTLEEWHRHYSHYIIEELFGRDRV